MNAAITTLSPYLARFGNVLFSCDEVCSFDFFGHTVKIKPRFDKKAADICCVFAVIVQDTKWYAAFDSIAWIRWHTIFSDLKQNKNAEEVLPEPVKQALLESMLTPVLQALERQISCSVKIADCFLQQEQMECFYRQNAVLAFSCHGTNQEDEFIANLFIAVPEESASLELLEKIERILPKSGNAEQKVLDTVPVPLSFCVGETTLFHSELQTFGFGDIVLFDEYYIKNNMLKIFIPFFDEQIDGIKFADNYLLAVFEGGSLNAVRFERWERMVPDGEKNMEQEEKKIKAEQETQEKDEASISLDTLPVTVRFELEQRMLTVAEIRALRSGYTFALSKNLDEAVNLVANGKKIASGKIVDINGMLGVQLMSINKD